MRRWVFISMLVLIAFSMGLLIPIEEFAKKEGTREARERMQSKIRNKLNKIVDRDFNDSMGRRDRAMLVRYDGYIDISNKKEVKCPDDSNNTLVIFTFGQSNAANHGEISARYVVKNNVVNIYNNKCYIANDPLLNTGGIGGGLWGRLGDIIIDKSAYDTVIIKSIAVGGSTVSDWSINGIFNKKIIQSISELKRNNLSIDIIMWHQGEMDNGYGTSKNEYKKRFQQIVNTFNNNGINSPISMAIASFSLLTDNNIVNAQHELIQENINIIQGPNTDLVIDKSERAPDRIHFSSIGLDKIANLWFESLIKENIIQYKKSYFIEPLEK